MPNNKLIKDIEKAAINVVKKKGVEIECPNCNKTITVKPSTKQCPKCKCKLNIKLERHQ